ncbi:hypothetical protein FIB43_18855 [Salmonella enterica]|nr:hypothetical protein [Salmonella enterica]
MRRILATAAALCLGGCITVYGPVKTGGQQQQDSQAGQQPGMSEQISTSFIGNRKPDELLNAVALYFREKAITASVNDQTTGIIAGSDAVEKGLADSLLSADAVSDGDETPAAALRKLDALLAKTSTPRSERRKLIKALSGGMSGAATNHDGTPGAAEEIKPEIINSLENALAALVK